MSEIIVILSALIAPITLVIGATVAPKYIMNQVKKGVSKDIIMPLIDEIEAKIKKDAEDWLNTEKGQQAIYQIGTLIGAGAKAGIGIGKTGKGSFKELIIQGGLQLLNNGGLGGLFGKQAPTEAVATQAAQM